MNSPFIAEQAKALASRQEVLEAKSTREKVTALYKLDSQPGAYTKVRLELAIEFTKEEVPRQPSAAGRNWPRCFS